MMSSGSATDQSTVLDAREIDEPPFGAITSALDGLDPEETLLLINSFEPEPLYDVLDDRGFEHETTRVDDGEWHVEVTPNSAGR